MRTPLWIRHAISLPIRRLNVGIRAGPNRGRRWSISASGQGIGSGYYERARFDAFAALVRPDDVFWDIGANHGYASLIAAGKIEPRQGAIRAFEPAAYNRWYLNWHLASNKVEHVTVESFAIADYVGASTFGGSGSSAGFSLGKGEEEVQVSTISELVADGFRAPTFLKVDIEGAESQLLTGAAHFLSVAASRGTLPLIILSVHSPALYRDCRDKLRQFGYEVIASHRLDASYGARWDGDPDLLAVPPGRNISAALELPWFAQSVFDQD